MRILSKSHRKGEPTSRLRRAAKQSCRQTSNRLWNVLTRCGKSTRRAVGRAGRRSWWWSTVPWGRRSLIKSGQGSWQVTSRSFGQAASVRAPLVNFHLLGWASKRQSHGASIEPPQSPSPCWCPTPSCGNWLDVSRPRPPEKRPMQITPS